VLVEERPLSIACQALGDGEPHHRLVEPLRLEERGQLYYLYACCYRAEADRVFRLDRLHECETD
jgi:predicted DNA-binding transcriptional regulator YafY